MQGERLLHSRHTGACMLLSESAVMGASMGEAFFLAPSGSALLALLGLWEQSLELPGEGHPDA